MVFLGPKKFALTLDFFLSFFFFYIYIYKIFRRIQFRRSPPSIPNCVTFLLLCVCTALFLAADDPSQWLADSDGGNHASNAAPGGSVFLPKRDAVSVLQKRSYGQGGIICECCIHRCEVSELQQYCSETDGRSRRRRSVRNILHLDASTLPGLTPEQRQRILKEQRDVADKQMVGRELLRQGPSWWAAAGQLALARAEDELTHAVPGKRQGSHGMKETAVIPDGAQDELQALLHS